MDGRLPEQMGFEGDLNENFAKFKQRFLIYLTANEWGTKPDNIKIAKLLHTIGSRGLEVYNTLKLSKEDAKKFDKTIKAFEKNCPPPKGIYIRYVRLACSFFTFNAKRPKNRSCAALGALRVDATTVRLFESGVNRTHSSCTSSRM
ncbi:hypothetical protein Zmor_014978 [Zophobas morio]|uniref:Uncharacterized protein n=1 Tax=Zophobas morio TaxID=2755281 RepID=A0AA38MHH7_9CUCU|nr:hypothetical protein Zmor_014978 [Zophobas morio]